MSPARTYAVLPDRGVCLHPGCDWHRDGADAEPLAKAHHERTRHQTVVDNTARVTFGTRRQVRAGAR